MNLRPLIIALSATTFFATLLALAMEVWNGRFQKIPFAVAQVGIWAMLLWLAVTDSVWDSAEQTQKRLQTQVMLILTSLALVKVEQTLLGLEGR